MRVSVFGLGYVGSVTGACLASQGHSVVGVDVNPDKVRAINDGRSPVVEKGLERLISEMVHAGRLAATGDTAAAVAHADVCLISVGTPSNGNGSLDLRPVVRVFAEIGAAIKDQAGYKVVTLRSTVLPGTLANSLLPILSSESGKRIGEDIGVAVNPEFLREGSAIYDFKNPPFTVIGQLDKDSGDAVASLYEGSPSPVFRTDPDTACMVKYASNAFHALKITFANEIGRLCKEIGLDSREVMDIFCQDTYLNISSRYLRPGFAFGGSCLPKDLRALVYLAQHSDVDAPALGAILRSNERQVQLAVDIVRQTGKRRVTLIGLTFKPETDDLRESPMVHLAETLLGKGYQLCIYDSSFCMEGLIGANRAFIEHTIPHITALLCDSLEEAIARADVVITAHGATSELAGLLRADQTVVDLDRVLVCGRQAKEECYAPVSG